MTTTLNRYIEDIKNGLRVHDDSQREVVRELQTHIEDRLQELKATGLNDEEAARKCLGLLGSASLVARQIYEAHSQGTWRQAVLAATPHLLFGVLFALNWWQYISWHAIVLLLVLGAAVYGWRHGKPTWMFPWLGYTLLPVIVAGIILSFLPKGWSFLAVAIYVPLAAWWLYRVIYQTVKMDWLFGTLMLLPLPMASGWVLALQPQNRLMEYDVNRVFQLAPPIGLSFLAMALSVLTFVRLRQRWLRITLLVISGLLTLTMIAYYASGTLTLPAFLLLLLTTSGLFVIPALLERRIRLKSS